MKHMVTLETLDKKFDAIHKRFERIDERFEKMDQRFEKMDQRFEVMDRKFDHMIDVFSKKFDSFEKKIDDKIDDLAAMNAREFMSIENRLDSIEENSITKDDLATAFAQSGMFR